MDRWKFLDVVSREQVPGNPISERKVRALIDLLRLPAAGRILDIARGRGEILVRTAQRWGVSAMGVDLSPFAVAHSRRAVSASGLHREDRDR